MNARFSVYVLLCLIVLQTAGALKPHICGTASTLGVDSPQVDTDQTPYPPTNTIPPPDTAIHLRTLESPQEVALPDLFRSDRTEPLMGKRTDLTYATNPTATEIFSITDDRYLGFDGCAWSPGISVKFELFNPNETLVYTYDSTWGNPAHFFLSDPPQGDWKVEMTILDRGNTTVWVQAISPDHGAFNVVSKHKDYVALLPGEALYFDIPTSDLWFGLDGYGSQAQFDLYNPSSVRVGDFWNSVHHVETDPEAGSWTFIVRIHGETDVLVQVTQPSGIAGTLSPPHTQLSDFHWKEETAYYRVPVSETDWLAVDGASQAGRVTFEVYDSSFQKWSYYSYSSSNFVHSFHADPQLGDFLVVVSGEKNAKLLLQLTQEGNEIASLSFPYDELLSFASAGQAAYFKIAVAPPINWFGIDGASQDNTVAYKLLNPNLDEVLSVSNFFHHLETAPTTGEWLLGVQGDHSNAAYSLRRDGDEYELVTTPYTAIFKFEYTGAPGYYSVAMKDMAWFAMDILLRSGRAQVYLYNKELKQDFYEDFRYSGHMEHFFKKSPESGVWLLVLLGQGQAELLISMRQTGEEDATLYTPHQDFVEFEYTGANFYYNVSVGDSAWLTADFGIQNSGQTTIYFYNPSFDLIRFSQIRGLEHWFEKAPPPGNWLIALIGYESANVSISLSQSSDTREVFNIPVYRFENFSFNGQTRFFDIDPTGHPGWIGFDLMFTYVHAITHFYLYDPSGNETWSTHGVGPSVSRKFLENLTGFQTIQFLSDAGGSTTINIASSLDDTVNIPHQRTINFNSTGRTYYLGFNVTLLKGFKVNATLQKSGFTNIFLYNPARDLEWSTSVRNTGRVQRYENPSPQPGLWILVFDAYVGVSLDLFIDILPFKFITLPIDVAFKFPVSSSLVELDDGNYTMLPQYSGTLLVEVNATHREIGHVQMDYVYLSYDGGEHWVEMLFNQSTGLWNYEWNSALAPNGQVMLVAYAEQGYYGPGIGVLTILVSNPRYTLTIVALDIEGEPIQDVELFIWHLNGTVESTKTNSTGSGTFVQLPSGQYPLFVRYMGVQVKDTIHFTLRANSHITAWCDIYDLSVEVISLLLAQPVVGAEVTLHCPDRSQRCLSTDFSGLASFVQLPLHSYRIVVKTWLGQETIEVELSRAKQVFLVRLIAPIDLLPFVVLTVSLGVVTYLMRRRRRKREQQVSVTKKQKDTQTANQRGQKPDQVTHRTRKRQLSTYIGNNPGIEKEKLQDAMIRYLGFSNQEVEECLNELENENRIKSQEGRLYSTEGKETQRNRMRIREPEKSTGAGGLA